MLPKIFNKLYSALNIEQKEAVDAIDGPVMVIAGPGTGKTQILTLRIANILRETDTNPDNILALTFTESAAYSMRKRLVDIIGSAAYRVNISTFHGFCNEIIKRFPEDFPRIIASTNITEVDQIRIVEDIIENTKLKDLKPYGDKFYYLYPIIRSISDLKRENIDTKEFEKLLRIQERKLHPVKSARGSAVLEKLFSKNKELVKVYKAYEKELAKAKLYDYDDMIMEVYRTLSKNHDLLATLQEEYQYILVDEHQDTNNAQNKVVELLAKFHDNPNIFVVGDEKQAIFRFQGASLENFLYFKKLYKKAKIITLEKNYRSSQNILDSAHSLISKSVDGFEEFRKNLRAAEDEDSDEEQKISVYSFSKEMSEYEFIARDIRTKVKAGVLPEEIAVLYRENNDSQAIAKVLDRHGVDYIIESNEDILSDNNLNKLFLILKAVNNFGSKADFINMAHVDFLTIDSLDLYRLINSDQRDFFGLLKNKLALKRLGVETPEAISRIYEKLAGWYKTEKNKNLLEFFEIIVRESGYLDYILLLNSSAEDLERLNSFFDEIKSLIEAHRDVRLKDLIKHLDLLKDHGVSVKAEIGQSKSGKSGKVRLMTAHRSKGLEFDYVYIIKAYDGHWGNKRKPNPLKLALNLESLANSDTLADERRLFYVALTRARIGVMITYATEGKNGMQLPSQFIEEIDKALVDFRDGAAYEKEFAGSQSRQNHFKEVQSKAAPLKDKEYLNGLFLDHGLSVTALNNYLECPWRYFYNNLVRIPTAIENSQMYGIALHETLKYFFDKYKTSGEGSKKLLLELLDKNFKKQPFSKKDFDVFYERAKRSISGYYDEYSRFWSRNILNEFNIKGVLLEDKIHPVKSAKGGAEQFNRVKINGKIDKIEILDSKSDANEVIVYDYKTAKPKSRNAIEGKTRSSKNNQQGNYKRQLVFYKLLLNLYDNNKYRMQKGVIDFLEPDERGRYKREAFEITDTEVAELTELIKKVSGEILDLSFWNEKCHDKKCEYCKLRGMMK